MKSIKILGLDYETQGFPAETTNVTEVGAVMVQVSSLPALNGRPTRALVGHLSTFCWDSSYPPQTGEIVALTGITDAMLKDPQRSVTPGQAYKLLLPMVEEADIIMCHNVPFDKAVFVEQAKRFADVPPPEKEWFCSLRDIPYEKKFSCKKLAHLSLDHGVKMDGRNLHRASGDVELMFDLVLGNYDIFDLLDYKRLPKITVKIDVLPPWKDKGESSGVAKSQGYNWNPDKQAWTKEILEKNFMDEKNAVPYRVAILG
jgi:DNA polymerase III epsilon subunit-like protein